MPPSPAPSVSPRSPAQPDFVKLTVNDKKVLRFRAMLVEAPGVPRVTQADVDRSFVLSVFLTDDTLSVYEPSVRNTGFPGGKFLERGIVTKDGEATGARYSGSDFFVGAKIRVYNRIFQLVEADGFTLNHMEQNPETWKASDLDLVLAEVRLSADADSLRALFEAAGQAVHVADLGQMLAAAGAPLSPAQLTTIARQWSADGKAQIPSAQFLQLLYAGL